MSKRTSKPAATTAADPATLAAQKLIERQRKNARRALLKRRRDKSGQ